MAGGWSPACRGFQRFDSLAVEAAGNICVATLITGCISVIAPDGRLVRQVPMPDPVTTNICFGGPDLRTAYVTLSGHRATGGAGLAGTGSATGLRSVAVGLRGIAMK